MIQRVILMITTAQISAAPLSGSYNEKIYDAPISTNNWTWVKLETNEFETFYGQFKGAPLHVALSKQNPHFYVLTDSLLYEISRENSSLYIARDYYDMGGSITNVTLTPSGKLLLSNDYELFQIDTPLCKIDGDLLDSRIEIDNPVHMDTIKFKDWHNNFLHIQANYFASNEPIKLYFDAINNKLYI